MMSERMMKLGGAEKAAVLLMGLGEEGAAEIVKHLGPGEVRKIGHAMAACGSVSRDRVRDLVQAFARSLEAQAAVGLDAGEYLGKVLTRALGEERLGNLLDTVLPVRNLRGFELLKWMEPGYRRSGAVRASPDGGGGHFLP